MKAQKDADSARFRNESIYIVSTKVQILHNHPFQPWSLLLKQINLSVMSLHFRVSKQLVSPWEAGNLDVAAIQPMEAEFDACCSPGFPVLFEAGCMFSSTSFRFLE